MKRVLMKTLNMLFLIMKTFILFIAIMTGMLFAFIWRSYELTDVDMAPTMSGVNIARRSSLNYLSASQSSFGYETDYTNFLKRNGVCSVRVAEELISYKDVAMRRHRDYKDMDKMNAEDKTKRGRTPKLDKQWLSAKDVGKEDKTGWVLESDYLRSKVSVHCMVMASNRKSSKSVKNTWGRHCNSISFHGSFADADIPVLRIESLEPSSVSFCKSLIRLIKVQNTDKKQKMDAISFDYLLIAEDKSYVIVENARKLLAPLSADDVYYLGRLVKKSYLNHTFNAIDSSIIMSRGAIKYLTDHFYKNVSVCNDKKFVDAKNQTIKIVRNFDANLGLLLSTKLAVDAKTNADALDMDAIDIINGNGDADDGRHKKLVPKDTRDKDLKSRFLPFTPERHIIPGMIDIYSMFWRENVYNSRDSKLPIYHLSAQNGSFKAPTEHGFNCCSNEAISFNGLTPTQLYLFEYLLYHMSVYKYSDKGYGNRVDKVPDSDGRLHDKILSYG